MGCKLPHVIRANRTRKTAAAVAPVPGGSSASPTAAGASEGTDRDSNLPQTTAEDAKLGDEYISLTFLENESEEESDEDADEDENDEVDDEDEE